MRAARPQAVQVPRQVRYIVFSVDAGTLEAIGKLARKRVMRF
jgi:hypothetical protein